MLHYRLSHKIFPGTNIGFYVLEALWLILTNDKVINPNIDANIISFFVSESFYDSYRLCTMCAVQLAEL